MFSDLERKIGLLLYRKEGTAEEIAEELKADIRDVLDSLKHLVKLKIVVKEGYPPKYRLSDHIKEAVEQKLEPVEGIKVRAVIEVQGVEEAFVKKTFEKIKKGLEKERGLHIVSLSISEIVKDEETGTFSGYIDAELSFEGMEPLMRFLFFYGPSVIEVLGPDRVTVDAGDLQRALLEASGMIQGYVTYITKLMTRKELEEFNRRMMRDLFK